MSNNEQIVFITGGGTGGHVYPAVAVYERLALEYGDCNVYYIGDPEKLDKHVAEENNMNFLPVIVSGMPRKLSFTIFSFLFELFLESIRCIGYIMKYKPGVIIGTGGYVSAPALIAGVLMGVPIILHDPDAYPGIVTRKLAPFAKHVNIAFKDAKKYIKNKSISCYGNPLRISLCSVTKTDAKRLLRLDANKKTLFVMGGSQGAQSINNAIKMIARELVEDCGIQIIHQTGSKNYESYCMEMKGIWWDNFASNPLYVVRPYFEDMSLPLNAADLVLCRAGSLSIAELNLCGVPSILIPYPHAAADHQKHNAVAMQKIGASLCIADKNCTAETLKPLILDLINDSAKLNQMSQANRRAAKPNAMNDLFNIISQYLA